MKDAFRVTFSPLLGDALRLTDKHFLRSLRGTGRRIFLSETSDFFMKEDHGTSLKGGKKSMKKAFF